MILFKQSRKMRAGRVDASLVPLLESLSEAELRASVSALAKPRNFEAEPESNRDTAAWLERCFRHMGYQPVYQGRYRNLVVLPRNRKDRALVLVGAHYDTIPRTPGADDNASGLAAMLACARVLAELGDDRPVGFLAFNREEDHALGSKEFVESFLAEGGYRIRTIHVLEMIGYADSSPGSQVFPRGLPLRMPDRGDFLALVGDRRSTGSLSRTLVDAATYFRDLPVLGLKANFLFKKLFPLLLRSDHEPFWDARIPALMWTDSAEFRNPHYHRPSDTPETLDYAFLRRVSQLLLLALLNPV